ncbi:MAG TPA: cyanophycin synthetase [Calditrichia bacterium]|nr:cyanophycin synthetase [Calditrichota bacterium]HQV30828.1 cyanophycin synthetase [Calditrichia bacterium]
MANLLTDIRVFYWRLRRFYQDRRVANRPMFEKLRFRFYEQLWRETAERLNLPVEDFGNGYFRLGEGQNSTFVLESKVQLDDHLSLRMAGNKPLVHRLLTENGFSIQEYREYKMSRLPDAQAFMAEKKGACVVKPAAGSGAGNGVTTHIANAAQLKRASLWAATFSPRLLIEEEIPGDSYRLLFLNGTFIDAVRRDPPRVTGDGKHSIAELMRMENAARLEGNNIVALSPLVLDFEARLHLTREGLSPKTVLPAGRTVAVKTVCNQNRSSENESVTAQVHPTIVEAGSRIAAIFNIDLLGVDLITPDVSRPLDEVGGVINEINTNPGLHHHYLVNNLSRENRVAERIIAYILENKMKKVQA